MQIKKRGYTYSWMKGNRKEKFYEDEKDLDTWRDSSFVQCLVRGGQHLVQSGGWVKG